MKATAEKMQVTDQSGKVLKLSEKKIKQIAREWKRPLVQEHVNHALCKFLWYMREHGAGGEPVPHEIVNMALEGLTSARKLSVDQVRSLRRRAGGASELMQRLYGVGILLLRDGIRACVNEDETFEKIEAKKAARTHSSAASWQRTHTLVPSNKLSASNRKVYAEMTKVLESTTASLGTVVPKLALPPAKKKDGG